MRDVGLWSSKSCWIRDDSINSLTGVIEAALTFTVRVPGIVLRRNRAFVAFAGSHPITQP
jgi:hypothetical protein